MSNTPLPTDFLPDVIVHADGGLRPTEKGKKRYWSVFAGPDSWRHESEVVGVEERCTEYPELRAAMAALEEIEERVPQGSRVLLRMDNRDVVASLAHRRFHERAEYRKRRPAYARRLRCLFEMVMAKLEALQKRGIVVKPQRIRGREMRRVVGH